MTFAYLNLPATSPDGKKVMSGEAVDSWCIPSEQYRTPESLCRYLVDSRTSRNLIIIEYVKTGTFTDRGAEVLQFHRVLGRFTVAQLQDNYEKFVSTLNRIAEVPCTTT